MSAPQSALSLVLASRLNNEARALRNSRTVAFGPCMRLLFENHETVRLHVAEMLRVENITSIAEARDEADKYAHLLPDGKSWKATLFIGLADAAERARELPGLNEAVHRLCIELPDGDRVIGIANEDLPDRHRARPSAVHFVRFSFDARQRALVWLSPMPLMLRCEHSAYPFEALIDAAVVETLRRDVARSANSNSCTPNSAT